MEGDVIENDDIAGAQCRGKLGFDIDLERRRIMACEALESTRGFPVTEAFERLFEERGLPAAMRTGNNLLQACLRQNLGATLCFAQRALQLVKSLRPLPRPSPSEIDSPDRFLRLGIAIERIRPGHPQQNGRHERMHLTLKQETARLPAQNINAQQERFDAFVDEFNAEHPHEALAMRTQAEVYISSPKPYAGLPDLHCPFHDRDILVTACGRICMHRKKINISTVLAGNRLGIKEVDDAIWLVSFITYNLGYIDLEQKTLQTIDNPFGTRVSPMSWEQSVTYVPGMDKD